MSGYEPKHMRRRPALREKPRHVKLQKPGSKRKALVLLATVVLLTAAAAVGTLAWLVRQGSVDNTFEVGMPGAAIEEAFDGSEKKAVSVTNTGNIPVYVRASVTIYLRDNDGKQYEAQEGTDKDYIMDWGDAIGTDWIKGSDGLYYYNKPLAAGLKTSNLIDSCKATDTTGEKKLVVDIAVQTIQAEPSSAVEDAWTTVDVGSDGSLTVQGGDAS